MPNTNLDEPFTLFQKWYSEAEAKEIDVPSAMSVSTVDPRGRPSSRMVLLKQFDSDGFVFYTNLESRKGGDIVENAYVSLLFHWKSLKKQIRIEGPAVLVEDAVADAYFATRDRGSQIGAWASKQSHPMEGRHDLEKQIAIHTAKFGISTIPRPPFWSGYRVPPDQIEFWSDGTFRLHERTVYTRQSDGWRTERLFP
ncbi:MAG: pyridoxamine 5'-phosphate oxidase [Alphaproteobacteria bacterium]|nr:pyridoxamine 5'-phosphate oxidase [Alphaproteobacteria bacterium]